MAAPEVWASPQKPCDRTKYSLIGQAGRLQSDGPQAAASRAVCRWLPVSSPKTCAECRAEVDEIGCAITPANFRAVGQFYEDFSQTTDEEVRELLASAAGGDAGP